MKLIEYLINNGLSEKEAISLIMQQKVLINNEIAYNKTILLKPNDVVRIKKNKSFVSRGAYKLFAAIKDFNLNVNNAICLDIGSSTGGFTQVLLQNGAKKVFALDCGSNLLDYSLRINPQVVVMEKTNLKNISYSLFNTFFDFIVCDVSFISVKNVFKSILSVINENTKIVILIKPQFEAKKEYVLKGGFVEEKHHLDIIEEIKNFALEKGFILDKVIPSPIVGFKKKNQEYLSLFSFKNNE